MTATFSEAVDICRRSAVTHGRTYSLAARLLPPARRDAVWCLYAWARLVDDVVDHPGEGDVEKRVLALRDELFDHLEGRKSLDDATGRAELICAATAEAARRWGVDPGHFDDFVRSMLMDVPGTDGHIARFGTWAELDDYMWGSACVIGLQVLPLLEVRGDGAEDYAAELGRAFQVTNFIRDLREDLERGRMYLPRETWAVFGVGDEEIRECFRSRRSSPAVRAAVRHFTAVNRAMYRAADPGIDMLRGPARHSIRAARVLYAAILDDIETGRTDPFAERSVVSGGRRIRMVLPHGVAAAASRVSRLTTPSPGRDGGPPAPGARATRRSGAPAVNHPR